MKIRKIIFSGKVNGSAVVAALFLAVTQVAGYGIMNKGVIDFSSILFYICILGLAVVYYALFTYVWKKIKIFSTKSENIKETNQQRALLYWGIMIICWIPVFLAAYPGFFCYDATSQLNQVLTNTYNTHHPLLHTWILGNIIRFTKEVFHSYEVGVVIYCIIQMLITTAVFTKIIMELRKIGVPRIFEYLSLCYYGIFPTVVMFGLCTTKDSMFSALLLLHIIYLYRLISQGKVFFGNKRQVACLVFTGTLMVLFRNNAIYGYLLFVIISFLFMKECRKQGYICFISILILGMVLMKLLSIGLHAESNNGLREMMSVPLQQLARSYHERPDIFEEKDKEMLFQLVPKENIMNYQEKNADPVKANVKIGINRSLFDFMKLWLKLFVKEPGIFMNATLLNTYQAWLPNMIIDGYCGVKEKYKDSETCYFSCEAEQPVEQDSKIPGLYQFYWNLSRNISFQKLPGISLLFSVGFLFQLIFHLTFMSVYQSKKTWTAVNSLILCMCLTCLLGPIVLVRYYLILFYGLPFYLGGTIWGKQQ